VLEHVIVAWRERIAAWLEEAAAAHPPVRPFDAESLADMLTVVFEGALVVARSMQDRRMFAAQVRHYRTYIELLFGSAGEPRVSS
jgi:TetR/AcrR family transcriptional repressor of nem operon